MLASTVNLYVFVVLDDGRIIRAGRLLVENLHMAFRGGYKGVFQYDPDYLNHKDRYALDPANLYFSAKTIYARRPEYGLHGVFIDSLPGRWGKRLLAYKAGFHEQHYTPAHLLEALGNTGIGALLYSNNPNIPSALKDPSIGFHDLAEVLDEAASYESSDSAPVELKFLITGGYSAGGARPKLLVKKEGYYLAKFSSIHDRTPSLHVELEAAGLELGRRIGLEIPDFEVCRIHQRPVLLIKRFDVTPGGGRRALLSFASLLNTDPGFGTYSAMTEVLRRHSQQPRTDLEQLFKQMIINVAIHNTDDHLQNFSMIHDSGGWRLSPVYDLTPSFLQNEQVLLVDGQTKNITTGNIINEGKLFGFSRPKTLEIVDSIQKTLVGWSDLITDEYARKQISLKMSQLFRDI